MIVANHFMKHRSVTIVRKWKKKIIHAKRTEYIGNYWAMGNVKQFAIIKIQILIY